MRKLNCLLIAFAIFAVACENSFDEQSKNQITLSSKTIEVHFESNEHTINVTSPYSWIAESKNDWISLTCDNGIAGTEELRFVCDRNLDELERKGTIVIKNEDFGLATELYVIQKAFMPELVVEQDKTLSFTEKGGSDIIKVSSNFNYSVSDNASWISCDKVEEGVRVTAFASDVVNERTAQVTIYSEKYNLSYDVGVSQGAFKPELSIDKEELYFDADGGSAILNITTNAEFSVTETADWITCSKSGNSVTITAYASTVTEERCADVIISSDRYDVSKVVKVRQYGTPNGFLSIADAVIVVRADEYSNILDYKCSIINEENEVVLSFKYGERPTEAVELEIGDYIFKVQSGEVPGAAWDSPVYGTSKPFKIVRNQTTVISEIVCSLMQVKVSVSYSADLFERLGAQTTTTISVGVNSLEYSLTESRAGFFLAQNSNNNVNFCIKGTYAADKQNFKEFEMSEEVRNVKLGQYSKIHFYIEHAAWGEINVDITINDWVTDEIIPL